MPRVIGILYIAGMPGGLWELFIGGWLMVKGFNESPSPLTTKN
jgi:hypothetical protein